jgi:hypothetical protein
MAVQRKVSAMAKQSKGAYVMEPLYEPVRDTVPVLHELQLGRHTLFILADNSIDLLDLSGEAPYLAENGLHLDSEETYRLLISLQEQFK